jgi:hypothetical protein
MRDFDLEQQLIDARRRRYGEQAQAQAPQGRMVGGRFVAPHALEYLAAGLRGFGGIRGQQMAEDELRQLQTTRQQAVADALRGFNENMQGTPEQVIPNLTPVDDEGNPMPQAIKPAQPQNIPAAFRALSTSPDAAMRQFGMQGMAQIPQIEAQKAEREAQREFQRQQAELQRQQRIEQLQMQQQMRLEAMREQNASREQMAQAQREFQKEMAGLRSSIGASSQPYFQPVQTAQGVMAFNARTGRVEPVVGSSGQPIIGAQYDPALQGSLAGSKTGATTEAKLRTEARLDAPKAIAQGEETIRLVDDLLKAPGMKQAVGASRMLGIQKIPGTPAKDFDVRLDQLKGQQFLQAFESLKGGGAITEIEGKKATDAIARMDAAGSEAEFTKAAREFQSVIRQGVARAKNAQGVQTIQPAQTTPPNELFNAADAILNRGKK